MNETCAMCGKPLGDCTFVIRNGDTELEVCSATCANEYDYSPEYLKEVAS